MITINIDIISLFIGLIIGIFITFFATFRLIYDDRWCLGFGAGYECGLKEETNGKEICDRTLRKANEE